MTIEIGKPVGMLHTILSSKRIERKDKDAFLVLLANSQTDYNKFTDEKEN